MSADLTASQYTQAITRALAAHDVKAAVAILHAMAPRHPREAQDVLDMLNVGIALTKGQS